MKRFAKWILFVGILISLGLAAPSQALTTPANRVDSEAVGLAAARSAHPPP